MSAVETSRERVHDVMTAERETLLKRRAALEPAAQEYQAITAAIESLELGIGLSKPPTEETS